MNLLGAMAILLDAKALSAVLMMASTSALALAYRQRSIERTMQGLVAELKLERQKSRELEQMAFFDPLTKLYNRAVFCERLQHSILGAERHGGALAVLMIDLDGFKAVNDSFGHCAGDELLIEIAVRLQACCRGCDLLARLGGDEFAFLLESVTQADSTAIANKIRQIGNQAILLSGGVRAKVGISVGAAHYPQDGDDSKSLLERADSRMYSHKRRTSDDRSRGRLRADSVA